MVTHSEHYQDMRYAINHHPQAQFYEDQSRSNQKERKFRAKDNWEPKNIDEEFTASHKIRGEMKKADNFMLEGKAKDKDKKDYAIKDKVIDNKTRIQIQKFVNSEFMEKMNSCISTGKEANVYHATGQDSKEFAIKIYKVETMVFRDREEYIEGERRFKKGHCRSNPRKLIKLWAEKEYRNLKRIEEAGIKCPSPLQVKDNLVVMTFIGKNEEAAPRLRDVKMTQEELGEAYLKVVRLMRQMYMRCKMVHADLSEYNILWDAESKDIVVIDVSQSVESDHPYSHEFLKRDIVNINNYYSKMKVNVFKVRGIFRYVTDATILEEDEEKFLNLLIDESLEGVDTEFDITDFMNVDIPRTLQDYPPEKVEEILARFKNSIDSILYAAQTGVINEDFESSEGDSEEGLEEDVDEEEGQEDNSEEEENKGDKEEKGEEEEEEDGEKNRKKIKDPRDGMDKKEWKAKVKEENKERRKNKMPKNKKKALINKSSHKK